MHLQRAIFSGALLGAMALAGCGGGSSPVTSAVPAPSTTAAATTGQTGTVTVSFAHPGGTQSHARTPQYVSLNSAAMTITVDSVNGSTTLPAGVPSPVTVQFNTNPGGNCTIASSIETCVIPIPTPPGIVVYTFAILSATGATLSEVQTSLSIAAGANGTNYAVTLAPIVGGVSVTQTPVLAVGAPSSGALTISVFDPSNSLIPASAANFFQPYTLTDNDTSGATGLSLTGGAPYTNSVTVTGPGQTVTLGYTGGAYTTFTLTATGGGLPSGGETAGSVSSIAFTGTAIDTSSPSDPNYNQQTLFFSALNQTEAFSVAQSGFSGAFSVTLDPTTCGTAPAVATVTSTGNASFSVLSNATGICKATVTGGFSQSVTLWLSVTTGGLNLESKKRT